MSKAASILVALALGGAAAASSTNCSVHRKSDELRTCIDSTDCIGRADAPVCDRGYCVATDSAACPASCTSCPDPQSCRLDCSADHPCPSGFHCPPGFDCTVRCSDVNCPAIDCAEARSCTLRCTGSATCGAVNCGQGACDVACSGSATCASIDCADACRCQVTCSGSAQCSHMSCPTAGSTPCTQDGIPGANCDPSGAGCNTCP